jgi:GrpB-like predicted nucleotidyltransferase (UPF0157 family)/ribosomal protein S18 acetylase RimI-like enzyme
MTIEKINLDNLTAEQVGKLFPIRIAPYNPDWKILFEQEKALITEALGKDMAHGVEHIGSTSIAGLAAKPTVDILVEVSNLNDEVKQVIIQKLGTIGYGNMCNAETENRTTFGKGYDENNACTQTFHVHICEKGNTPQDEIYFRDYLRQNSDVRDEYAELKYALAEKYRFNREDYTQAKSEFIVKITERQKMTLMNNIEIRPISVSEYPLLEDFLYHAIFIPPGVEPPPRGIIYEPEIFVYVKDFGGNGDCGVVAECDGKIIGAAWTRIIPAYGHIDDQTPELAISVLPDWRGQGTGSKMIKSLFALLRERGYRKTSLSVQKDNPAVRFYGRLGYHITGERRDHVNHEDYLMIKDL